MTKFVLRRLLQMLPVALIAMFLIYWMVFALPGDPTANKCGDKPCSPEFIAQFRKENNLDDPLLLQYVKYLGNVVRGDLGTTYQDLDVASELASRFKVTAKLALIALGFEFVVGVLAGVLAGIRKGGFVDSLVLVSTLFVIAIPSFVLGSVAQTAFGVKLAIFPVTVSSQATFYELLLPGLVLGSLSLAYVARLTRTSLVENLRADYVRTATAKGLTRNRVIGVHTLRNSLIPVVTFAGADFGALLGGAIVTEAIFNIPGVGGFIANAVRVRDGVSVVGSVTALVLVYLLMNLLVDLLYGVLDPRISND
ncbi:ABC transporter permease [Janibacter melonis]|uniref:ABC transporter permease n=1 Tax=Janibacter melonis TaxID=262209 RepID=A0A176Q9Z9_9MICO|nr:ABC transporter permease [Janibacter melonis]MBD5830185.1 ABC transporter permease [Janibacter melonis]OAB86479.1 ABC transporter permease [Janibacter melonis]